MITNPTPQRSLRGHRPARPTARVANTEAHHTALAARLTPRDRWIIRMLHEHRVLTAHQIGDMAFPSYRSGRLRLRELYQWSVLDRFQPFITVGSAPMHYVLAPAGATALAAEHGLDPTDLGYRHDRAHAIAHSLHLAHTLGVADWFTALTTNHETSGGGRMAAWRAGVLPGEARSAAARALPVRVFSRASCPRRRRPAPQVPVGAQARPSWHTGPCRTAR